MTHRTLFQRERDYYRTGVQDCANVFDETDVPSADDLREAFDASFELDPDDVPHTPILREAWVRGWLYCAAIYLARETEIH